MINDLATMTSPELARLVDERTVAVMVLGAIEQHGPHLPMATDLMIGEGLLAAAFRLLQHDPPACEPSLIRLPSLAIGASQEHGHYPGTVSLPPELARRVIESIGQSLASTGVRRLVLVNAHGGNHAVMDSAALKLRRRFGMLVVKASYMRFAPPDDSLSAEELRHGLHGGQAETAMMLHLAPESVRKDQIREFAPSAIAQNPDGLFGPAGRAAWAWLAEDLNPEGVVGRADLASADLGRRLVDHYGRLMVDVMIRTGELEMDFGADSDGDSDADFHADLDTDQESPSNS